MSSGSAEPALDGVAEAFTSSSGHEVAITYNAVVEPFDVLVASREAMERRFGGTGVLDRDGVCIGRMGIGVATRTGAPTPDIADRDSLRTALLAADTILITDNHTSGRHMEAVMERLGVYRTVAARIERHQTGPAALERLIGGDGDELAFLSANEIRLYTHRGATLVGMVPDSVQKLREFVAVAAAESSKRDVARCFVQFCGGDGAHIFASHGFV